MVVFSPNSLQLYLALVLTLHGVETTLLSRGSPCVFITPGPDSATQTARSLFLVPFDATTTTITTSGCGNQSAALHSRENPPWRRFSSCCGKFRKHKINMFQFDAVGTSNARFALIGAVLGSAWIAISLRLWVRITRSFSWDDGIYLFSAVGGLLEKVKSC